MDERTKLITCGLGDWIALTSFLPLPQKILLATSRASGIGEMCRVMGVDISILEDHWTYYFKHEVEARHGPLDVEDWGVYTLFPRILAGEFGYRGSPLLERKYPRRLDVPYTVVCPASMNKQPGRDLTASEMNYIMDNTSGLLVVLNRGDFRVQPHKRVLDLSNRTSVMEAVSYLVHADSFMGIDTWEACLFAQLHKPMLVKSVNQQFYENRSIYLAPLHEKIKIKPYLF